MSSDIMSKEDNGRMKKKSHDEFVNEMKRIHPDIEVREKYDLFSKPVAVHCNKCGFDWAPIAGSLLRGHGCPVCTGSGQITGEAFVRKLATIRDDVILVGPYENALKKTDFKFLNCGHVCEMTPSKITSLRGCPKCSAMNKGATRRFTMDKFMEVMNKIDPNLEVVDGQEYKNELSPIALRCRSCGNVFSTRLSLLRDSKGCPCCHRWNTSFFEQFILHSFVKVFGIDKVLTRDKKTIGEELDIVVPSMGLALEPGSWFYHHKNLQHDLEKKELCSEKGIRLIVIYDHYPEATPPFDDCIVFKKDLAAKKNRHLLMEIVEKLLRIAGHSTSFTSAEWDEIEKLAWKDSRRMNTEDFKKELARINPSLEFLDEYGRALDKKLFRCKVCGFEWMVAPTTVRCGSGCPKCARTLKFTDEAYRERLSRYYPHIMPLEPFKALKTPMSFTCGKCGYSWSTMPYRHINKRSHVGCPYCEDKRRMSYDKFVADVAKKHPNLEIVGRFEIGSTRITVRCRNCGWTWQANRYTLLKGRGCSKCRTNAMIELQGKAVRCIKNGETFPTMKQAAQKYKISSHTIKDCCEGKRDNAGGMKWEYVHEM